MSGFIICGPGEASIAVDFDTCDTYCNNIGHSHTCQRRQHATRTTWLDRAVTDTGNTPEGT